MCRSWICTVGFESQSRCDVEYVQNVYINTITSKYWKCFQDKLKSLYIYGYVLFMISSFLLLCFFHSPSTTQPSNNNKTVISTQGSPANPSTINPSEAEVTTTPEGNYNLCESWRPKTMHSSWNVLGVPPSGAQHNSPSNRNQTRTSNWFYWSRFESAGAGNIAPGKW